MLKSHPKRRTGRFPGTLHALARRLLMDFYSLFKTLALALLAPPGLMLPPLLALLLLWRRAGRWRWCLPLGFALMWLSLCEAPALLLQRALLNPPPALQLEAGDCQSDKPTLVLVLGGGVHAWTAERNGPDLKLSTLERLRHGVFLARRCHWPLGFTGGMPFHPKPQDLPEAQVAATVASEEFGLPLSLVEASARDTRENARMSLPLLREQGVRRLVLVTHAEHMPRSLRAFEDASRDAGHPLTLLPAPVAGGAAQDFKPSDWLPSEAGYRRMRYVFYEYLGLLAGH